MPQTHYTCLLYQHLVHGLQVLPSVSFPTPRMTEVAAELQAAPGQQERARLLLQLAKRLPAMSDAARTDANRVMGCTAQVWVSAELEGNGLLSLTADSDSELSRGLAAVLVEGLSGLTPEEVLQVRCAVLRCAQSVFRCAVCCGVVWRWPGVLACFHRAS